MKLAALAKTALALLIRRGWGEPVGIGTLIDVISLSFCQVGNIFCFYPAFFF